MRPVFVIFIKNTCPHNHATGASHSTILLVNFSSMADTPTLQSGSTSEAPPAPLTSKDTSSSAPSNDCSTSLGSLAAAATLNLAMARKWTPSGTAQKRKAVSRGPGEWASPPPTFEDATPVSSPLPLDFEKEYNLAKRRAKILPPTLATVVDSENLPVCTIDERGATWSDSTSGARPAPGNRRSSTTHSVRVCAASGHTLDSLRFARTGYDHVYALAGKSPLWFDSYEGESVLLIDEYQGGIDAEAFLRVVDGHPYQAPCKHGFIPARWTVVVVVSNYELFSCMPPELKRRFGGGVHELLGRRGDYVQLAGQLRGALPPPN